MARIYNKIRISQDNNQLLDIFYNSSYLELGNIDYEILKKLLKKKVMNINEVVNFNIQNIGVGASKVSNEQVKSLIPYIFFDSITLKDHSVQLFLTHGLLSYRNKENKELFAPLILIPIILTFSYENVYMQVIGEPIENRRLISYLIDNYNIKISMSEKLNTVYQLDRFCMQFERFDNMDVRVENYLTYATITYPQIVINHDKFSLKSLNNNLNYTNINNISPLSQKQMIALDRARSGNSFAITGYLGTGKTTTLINIACDGYSRGQKVLYVSNNRDTLNNIYSIFHNNGLDSILIDLTRSFSRFYANSFDAPEEDENNEQILLDSYNQINDYEKLLSLRILNFRFLDVLKNKFLIEEPEEEIELDDLSNLYKHEYDEIIHSLEVIQSKMVKLEGTFKESKFKNIPINHNIKYPNQIISLLFQIHKSFSELSLNSKILINDYGFKTIPNYAKLRNIITDFNNLDVSKVPDSWKDINNFKLATVKFNDLKNLIYTVQELELYLDWDYQNLETINIEEEINNIINPYFSINETSKINKLLENHHKIITRLHTANLSATNYLKAQIKIKEFLDWEFTDSDNAIEEIIRLTNYLNENFIHKRWLNINNYEINRKKIISLQNKLSHYYDLLNLYHKYFNNIDYLKANITRLSNYQKTGKKLKKYRNVDLNDLIAKFKELRSLQKSINKINDDYYELVGKYYNPNYDIIIDYDNFYKYLISIINSDYRYKIIKFISDLDYSRLGYYLRYFNIFKSAYNITKDTYQYISKFLPKQRHSNHYQKVLYLQEVYEYMLRLKNTNLKMVNVIKQNQGIIKIEEYLQLSRRLKELKSRKQALRNNKLYKNLYGPLFNYEKTNINEIGSIIKKFKSYSDCFNDPESVRNSLNEENYQMISNILKKVNECVYETNETFKLYGKIFKDGVGNYYYEDFDEVTSYLSDLMKAKDELIIYLEITDHLKVITKYKLFILNNIIINNAADNIVNLFKYKYFSTLYNLFIKRYPEVLNTEILDNSLLTIGDYEKKIIKSNINNLRGRFKPYNNSSYEEYLKNAGKIITITNTYILNQHLDIKDFDIVLIDDAHQTNANEFYKAISGKQVIIAGEYIVSSSSSANLISRIRPSNIMSLNYRFSPTPLRLLSTFNIQGLFLPDVDSNRGYETINYDTHKYIARLFVQNPELNINYYTTSLSEKRKLYDKIAQQLLDNKLSVNAVLNILTYKLHIFDIYSGYDFDSDYNIISLDTFNELVSLNIDNLANLFLCRKKIIIIDNNEERKEEVDLLEPLLNKEPLFNQDIKEVLGKLTDKLKEFDIIVHGSYYDLSLVLEKNNRYYGVLLYVNPDTSHINILEDYRNYYQLYKINNIPITIIWITDLVNDFENTVEKIMKGIG